MNTYNVAALRYDFLRVQCDACHAEHLLTFSWTLLCISAHAALVIPFTLRTSRLLPQLRGTPYGQKCCLAGG